MRVVVADDQGLIRAGLCHLIDSEDDLEVVGVRGLTTFELDENVLRALCAGASGFLGKGAAPDELLSGIRTVSAGESLLSPRATRALISYYLASPNPRFP